MAVYHILKDGSTVKDITGHVVRLDDATVLCSVIRAINERGAEQKNNTYNCRKTEVTL